MKKIFLNLLFLISAFASFGQSGSQALSGVFLRVNDTTTYQAAAATRHSQGYHDIYFNNQATTPHFDIWNGSSYDHVFDFASGGGVGGAVSSVFGRTGAVVAVAGDYEADEVTNTPAGTISATDVQAAINELDTEKVPTSRIISTTSPLTGGGDLSGNLTLGITGSALTKTDDTNVTLTLGGTSSTALLNAVSLTLGWTGQLGLSRGGTNANLTASNGGIFYSTASAGAILAGTSTAGQILRSGSLAAPSWSTATYPATAGTSGNVLTSDGTNFVSTTPAFYTLAAGGTASSANTFTFNTPNWNTWTSAFTTTADAQWANRYTGTITLRNTINERYAHTFLDPVITIGANNQVAAALTLSPSFTPGAFTTPTMSAIHIRNVSATSNMNAPFYYEDVTNVANKMQIRSDGSIRFGNIGTNINGIRGAGTNNGQLIIQSDFSNSSTSGTPSIQFTSNTNSSGTGARIFMGTGADNIFQASSSSSFTYFWIKPVLSPSGANTLTGIEYEPNTSSSTSTGTHLFIKQKAGGIVFDSDISPAQLTANTDNYNPTGWTGALTLRLNTDASRNLTSVAGGEEGRLLIIFNVGSQNLVIKDDDGATGTAANRFQLNADITILPEQGRWFMYDGTSSRWRAISNQ